LDTSDDVGARRSGRDRPAHPARWPGEELTPLEEETIASTAAGDLVDRGEGPFSLAEMRAWGEERTVRAEVLRHLLVAGQWPVGAKGVRLRGIRISGHLDLEAAVLRCPLVLDCCYLDADEPACLDYACAPRVSLTRCQLPGLSGDTLVARELDLSGSTLTGPLRLPGADIAGQLSCRGAQLTGHDDNGDALAADGMKAGRNVVLDMGFTAAGTVRLVSADIAGSLSFIGARLDGPDENGYALSALGIRVGGNVFLIDGFTAAGAVDMGTAMITGFLSCSGAQLAGHDQDGYALAALGIRVGGSVNLGEGFTAAGAVEVGSADIAGSLSFIGARLDGHDQDGYALSALGIRVGGNVHLTEGFIAAGAVELAQAEIKGSLSFSGAQLTGHDEDGYALSALGIRVGGAVSLTEGFTAAGAVGLAQAEIKGSLSCSGARLTGHDEDGYALSALRIKVGGNVFVDDGFTTAGAVKLAKAEVTGSLVCAGARLAGHDEDGCALNALGIKVGGDVDLVGGLTAGGGISLVSARMSGSLNLVLGRPAVGRSDPDQGGEGSLDASHAQVAGTVRWRPTERVRGQVHLRGAAAGELVDDWAAGRENGYWPDRGRLSLDGFTYGSLGEYERASVDQRLTWIRSQYRRSAFGWLGFATQPYEQLSAVYRQAGQDAQARKVAIARRTDLRRYGNLNPYRRLGNWVLDKTIKYGYQAWRAGVGLAAVFVAFTWLSFLAQQHHLMEPVGNTLGLRPVPSATRCTSNYPCFYPVGYAVDTVIPIINVHQADNWGPDGNAPWGQAWVAVTWVATGSGWALATLLVAGYTGLVRQQ
jgi:hypothetical protein